MVTDPGAYVLQFGKHRGKRLDQVPARYLTWCLEEMTGLYPETRRAIRAFLTPPDLYASDSPTERQATSPPGEPKSPRQRRQAPRRRETSEQHEEYVRCHHCGGPGTADRPLIHADCSTSEVPF